MTLLRAVGIDVAFSGLQILEGAGVALARGARLGLLGANGSGKTTLLSVLGGQVMAGSGSVWLDETDITHLSVDRRARLGISRLFQDSRLWDDMTVAEHLQAVVDVKPACRAGIRQLMDRLQVLPSSLGRRPGELTLLQRRRVELCMALYGAKVLLCDELGAGLDDDEAGSLYRVVRHACEAGWIDAALMVEHRQRILAAHCTSLASMEHGRVIPLGDTVDRLPDVAFVRALDVLQDRGVREVCG